MTHSLFSMLAQMALALVVVAFSLSPVVLAAFLSGQVSGFGGVL